MVKLPRWRKQKIHWELEALINLLRTKSQITKMEVTIYGDTEPKKERNLGHPRLRTWDDKDIEKCPGTGPTSFNCGKIGALCRYIRNCNGCPSDKNQGQAEGGVEGQTEADKVVNNKDL